MYPVFGYIFTSNWFRVTICTTVYIVFVFSVHDVNAHT